MLIFLYLGLFVVIYKFGNYVKLGGKRDLVLGAFDSFHKGHQRLFECLTNIYSALVSIFEPLPACFFRRDFPGSVCTFKQRCEFVENLGIREVLLVDFSYELSRMTGEDFLENICHCIPVRRVIVGSDFCTGARRAFCVDSLRCWGKISGIDVSVVDLCGHDGLKFSSEMIRWAILEGDLIKVRQVMGRPYSLDLRGLEVKRVGSHFFYSLGGIKQVFPCSGVYKTTSGGIVVLRKRQLIVEGEMLGDFCFFEDKLE